MAIPTEGTKRIFNIESLATEWKIDSTILKKLIKEAQEEFPNDEMMVELHVVRALRRSRFKNVH